MDGHMREVILQYLRVSGAQLDSQIAVGTDTPIADVRAVLRELSNTRDLITSHVTRFEEGKKIEGTLYRASPFIPPPRLGRKSKAQIPEAELAPNTVDTD